VKSGSKRVALVADRSAQGRRDRQRITGDGEAAKAGIGGAEKSSGLRLEAWMPAHQVAWVPPIFSALVE
jgi:hypothetical protein